MYKLKKTSLKLSRIVGWNLFADDLSYVLTKLGTLFNGL